MSSVRLIAVTQPVTDDAPDAQALLAFFARVSSTANQHKHETGPKLIRSLITRQEWSPLEMVSLTMEIVTTRDIARQILRHRSFSFQEFSQRYAKVEFQPVIREARLQHPTDRQASIEIASENEHDQAFQHEWQAAQWAVAEHAQNVYETALANGIAKEVARAVLPEGTTESRLFMAGTLRSWWHYTELRSDWKTQKEHREIAQAAREIIVRQFPAIVEART